MAATYMYIVEHAMFMAVVVILNAGQVVNPLFSAHHLLGSWSAQLPHE